MGDLNQRIVELSRLFQSNAGNAFQGNAVNASMPADVVARSRGGVHCSKPSLLSSSPVSERVPSTSTCKLAETAGSGKDDGDDHVEQESDKLPSLAGCDEHDHAKQAIISPLDGIGHPIYGYGNYEVAEQGLYVKARETASVAGNTRQQGLSGISRQHGKATNAVAKSPSKAGSHASSVSKGSSSRRNNMPAASRNSADELPQETRVPIPSCSIQKSCIAGAAQGPAFTENTSGMQSQDVTAEVDANATLQARADAYELTENEVREGEAEMLADTRSTPSISGGFPHFALGAIDLEASHVLSDADGEIGDLASDFASQTENAGKRDALSAPVSPDISADPPQSFTRNAEGSKQNQSRSFEEDDEEEDIEAMMLKSMQSRKPDVGRPLSAPEVHHSAETRFGNFSRALDALGSDEEDEDDVEAMMLKSMQSGMPGGARSKDSR